MEKNDRENTNGSTIGTSAEAGAILSGKPAALRPIWENIPQALRERRQWVNWMYRPARSMNGTPPKKPWTKVPLRPSDGGLASTTRRGTWHLFKVAKRNVERNADTDGVGYVLQDDEVGIDLDGCRNPETGAIDEWAAEIIHTIDSYTEISPSGTGVRIICKGELPAGRNRRGQVEIYDRKSPRYLTITGQHHDETPTTIEHRQAAIEVVHSKYLGPKSSTHLDMDIDGCEFDDDISVDVGNVLSHLNGKWELLWQGRWDEIDQYPSQSEADAALCHKLAAVIGPDPETINTLFRRSGLYRDKWERDDYRMSAISHAVDWVTSLDHDEDFTEPDWRWRHLEAELVESEYEFDVDVMPLDLTESVEPAQESVEMQQAKTPSDSEASGKSLAELAADKYSEEQYTKKGKGYRFTPLSSADFAERKYRMDWLIRNVLVKNQPCILGGPKKSMKTTILTDMVVSFGSGTPFLGKFDVNRAPCAFISGESGEYTIQETANRICSSKGVRLREVDIWWDFRLPRLSQDDELLELSTGLASHGIEVAVIDPLYLCLLSGGPDKQAQNLFDMGPLLLEVSRACLDVGCTPILAHHARKNLTNPHQAMDLEDLAFAGVQEFARQWMLINRRKAYQPGSGQHELWLTAGGSVGHGGLWGVDVDEGMLRDDFTGRKWDVTVKTVEEVRQQKASRKEQEKEFADDALEIELITTLRRCKTPPTKTKLSNDHLGWYKPKFNRILQRTIDKGIVRVENAICEVGKGATRQAEVIVFCGDSDHRS